MIRLFEQHEIRKQKELEGIWNFVKEDKKEYALPVPSCWEQHPDLLNYRGKGTFYKTIFLEEKTNIRLEFKGVSHSADVYLDDKFITNHYNAFTPFSAVVKQVEKGEHIIKVEVDNSFGEHSALHIPNDYYTYGGIIRPVVLEELKEVYIKNIHFTPEYRDGKWFAKTEIWFVNLEEKVNNINIIKKISDKIDVKKINLKPLAEEKIIWQEEYENIKQWSVEEPNLYNLEVIVQNEKGICIDDLIERVGFRQIDIKGRKLMINNEPIFLKGFNRHEDYGNIGCAIPLQLMVQDMDLMQDMRANAVRTCHYPNDERFLDLCDERGILVWEENHARGFGLKEMQNPNFENQCKDCIDEMIENHYNHPSIIIWGILNECASETQEGRIMYEKQYNQIKCLDRSRPTTSATCRHFTDICLDLPDIVSFNMYSGWYQDVSVLERHNQEMDWIEKSGGEGKPVIVSEFGAAAIYGYRDRGRCKWSEERQADIIEENIEVYKEDERLTGIFIWQFADCRVTEEGGWFASRARCHNNKGVVDEYRRPKEAYDIVKKMFSILTV